MDKSSYDTLKEEYLEVIDIIENKLKRINEVAEFFSDYYGNDIEKIYSHLAFCGFIPERFKHDSSEEKRFSKYTEVIVSQAFKAIDVNAKLILERSNRADVLIQTEKLKIATDTKAFRLSRSALNPKDYKINAMVEWMKTDNANGGLLIASLFPGKNSRLWQESFANKILVLSYTQVAHLIKYCNKRDIEQILQDLLDFSAESSIDGDTYWQANHTIIERHAAKLDETKKYFNDILDIIKKYEIDNLANVEEVLKNKSKEELIEMLKENDGAERIKKLIEKKKYLY